MSSLRENITKSEKTEKETLYKFTEFAKSFLNWETKAEHSFGRFLLESTCLIAGIETSNYEESYYLAAGVMAGNLYENINLPKVPSYKFQIAASKDYFYIFRDYQDDSIKERKSDNSGLNKDVFSAISFDIKTVQSRTVGKISDIISHVYTGAILNAKVEFKLEDYAVTLVFPIKHINVRADQKCFQVETGPVLVPANLFLDDAMFSKENIIWARSYVFFNSLETAEFLMYTPSGRKPIQSYDFSFIRKMSCPITLLTPDVGCG